LDKGDNWWKLLLVALGLVVFGVFLMFESSSMLFAMNPYSLVVILFGGLFIFAGIVLIVIALTATAAT